MTICGQTLILIDNDSTLTEVNQKIIKSTVKYMLYHLPENRAFSINNYTHTLEEEENFSQDINDLLCKLDLMEFKAKDSNLTDTLTQVLKDWKESDFACRDIVVFTDGLESEATEYVDEELFYIIENTSYPVYIVDLVQDNNATAKKHLSAIATTSGGKLLLSEYPGDDAGVDKHLTEEIFRKMDEYAQNEWGQYENPEGASESASEDTKEDVKEENKESEALSDEKDDEDSELINEEIDSKEYLADSPDMTGEVLYESKQETGLMEKPAFLLASVISLMLFVIAALVSSLYIMKKRRKDKKEDDRLIEIARQEAGSKKKDGPLDESYMNEDLFFSSQGSYKDVYSDNMFLDDFTGEVKGDYDDGYCKDNETKLLAIDEDATRLLVSEGLRLSLTDIRDEREHQITVKNYCIIGRRQDQCDFCINDDSISKRHCRIINENSRAYIEDSNSSNGSFVNGKLIEKREEIKDGDILRLGTRNLRVKIYG